MVDGLKMERDNFLSLGSRGKLKGGLKVGGVVGENCVDSLGSFL